MKAENDVGNDELIIPIFLTDLSSTSKFFMKSSSSSFDGVLSNGSVVEATEGDRDFHIFCGISRYYYNSIMWYRRPENQDLFSLMGLSEGDEDMDVNYNFSEYSYQDDILIPRIKMIHGGSFECRANHLGNSSSSQFITLHVSPMITPYLDPDSTSNFQSGQVFTVEEGRSFRLSCHVLGHPKPVIFWRKDDQALSTVETLSEDQSILQIRNVSLEDSGKYSCLAENRGGKFEISAFLRVQKIIQDEPNKLLIIALPVMLIISIVALISLLVYWKRRGLI